ncbi:MAG: hypothetical protein AMXMBFR83_16410 [Phycisphaerae bacterium]
MNPRTPTYRRHKPTGQAVVTLNGHDVYLGKWRSAASRREYDRVLAEWLANGRWLDRPDDNEALTVAMLIERYWREHVTGWYVKAGRPTSEQDAVKSALRPLRRLYGDTLAADFGPLKLTTVRDQMIAAGWCRGTVNGAVHRVRRMFRWAVSRELVPANVLHALRSVPALVRGRCAVPDPDPVRPVADEHVDAVRPFVPPAVWAMIQLQRLSGMRPGEAVIMRGCDLDTSGPLWEYRPAEFKTQHHEHLDRVIPLGPRAQAVLRPFLKNDLQAYLFDPRQSAEHRTRNAKVRRRPGQKPTPRKTRRTLGECYTTDSYRKCVTRACAAADRKAHADDPKIPADQVIVPVWTPNQLRHAAGTRIRQSLGLEAAQVVLGHANARVTQIYAERNLSLAREIAAKLG